MAKKLSKFEIACAIEKLPGNIPWTAASMATIYYDHYTRNELVSMHNEIIVRRKLDLPFID